MTELKYLPLQSFIESSFFTKLSQLKLDKYKLNTSSQKINGFLPHPTKLNKFNDTPILNLDSDSFDDPTVKDDSKVYVYGDLLNVNTIQEFKSLDKQKLLYDWGNELFEKIVNQEQLSYLDFNKFFILSFSDLKSYKFYYWVAYPALSSKWIIEKEEDVPPETIEIIELQLQQSYAQFYQLHDSKTKDSTGESKPDTFVYIDSSLGKIPSIQLKNYLYTLAIKNLKSVDLIIYRKDGTSQKLSLGCESLSNPPKCTGWERTNQGKLGPKLADLGSLINPRLLAEQATELNLKLMKWRIAPDINLDILRQQKVLLLGAGTLGSYVSRALLGWGFKDITLLDNGRISYSNPVRQPLFNFKDCFSSENQQGEFKAIRGAEALKEIYPGVNSKGVNLEVPMIGHPITDETRQRTNFETLEKLFDENDVIFLLMDSRESRWLPTVLGAAKDKIVINAALGFDSYLIMRHGSIKQEDGDRLGCYYCNDVVAPNDSLSDRTLDQMCTVTRPGGALIASSLAVELLVSLLQHPNKQLVKHNESTKIGEIPHQIRGFLNSFSQTKLYTPNYSHCSACSKYVIDKYNEDGWDFIRNCLNNHEYLEEICGLKKIQQEAELATEQLLQDLEINDIEDDEEWLN
ncbi:unnamed protein product [Candida verbasci]|uniref:Ubiquitin-like modifier-activating enzyme ATG7 n=1 Tax=Candida verbasci TaxID=1227364 RepID=A0A9W4XB19_9ASCO|nr:unnamed protein product [Candida verbasci]